MELKVSLVLLLLGCLLTAEGSYYNRRRLFHPLEISDRETSKHLNARYEKSIEDAWKRQTKADDNPPRFYSQTFESNITGKTMITFHNREIYAFQGFRYGEGVRFQPPTPVDKFWDGDNFDAIHIGFKCPQGSIVGSEPAGDEDCLFLNVYTPYLPTDGKKLPVMLFIHGGSFTSGDASTYMPTRLLDHDVILVTIHYRLGAFGFFTLNNEDAPGNAALYDMVESLRWTQKYIDDFGGDKNQVTVMGESAGSVAVNYMMIVPPAQGLLHAIIAESGSCFDHWGLDEDPTYATHYLADYLGCDSDNDTEIFECMSNVDPHELVKAEGHMTSNDKHMGLMGFRGASPTIQTFQLSENAAYDLILTQRPREYFSQRDFSKVPFLTGANKQEGSFVVGIMYGDFLLYHQLQDNVTYLREQMLQDIVEAIGISDDTHSISTSLQKVYCPDIDLANLTAAVPCLIDLAGVLFLKAGSWEVANYHSYYSGQPTYYYSFEFESDDSLFAFTGLPFDGGVTHADDLLYLFSLPAVMDFPGQVETVDRLTLMWTNFATYFDPTPKDQTVTLAELGLPIWTPYKFEDHHVLVIADVVTVSQEFSDRWTITLDELRAVTTEPPVTDTTTTEVPNENECTGLCADYKDQRAAFEATMIVFIVLTFIAILVAVYFGFKARR